MNDEKKELIVFSIIILVWGITTIYSFYKCQLKTGTIKIELTRYTRNAHNLIFYEGNEKHRFYPHRFFEESGEKVWPFYIGHQYQIEYRGYKILNYVDLTTEKTYIPERGPG